MSTEDPDVLSMPATRAIVLVCRLFHAVRVGDFTGATRLRRELNHRWRVNITFRDDARERLIADAREAEDRETSTGSAPQGGAGQAGPVHQTKKEDGGGPCLRTPRRLQDQASTALPPSRERSDTP
jgi:hypothetical protein